MTEKDRAELILADISQVIRDYVRRDLTSIQAVDQIFGILQDSNQTTEEFDKERRLYEYERTDRKAAMGS